MYANSSDHKVFPVWSECHRMVLILIHANKYKTTPRSQIPEQFVNTRIRHYCPFYVRSTIQKPKKSQGSTNCWELTLMHAAVFSGGLSEFAGSSCLYKFQITDRWHSSLFYYAPLNITAKETAMQYNAKILALPIKIRIYKTNWQVALWCFTQQNMQLQCIIVKEIANVFYGRTSVPFKYLSPNCCNLLAPCSIDIWTI